MKEQIAEQKAKNNATAPKRNTKIPEREYKTYPAKKLTKKAIMQNLERENLINEDWENIDNKEGLVKSNREKQLYQYFNYDIQNL